MSIHTFDVEPSNPFENAAIYRPRELVCFSYDEDHKFRLDSSSLRYYYPPALPADLSKGFDTFRELDDSSDDHLDGLLEALIAHERVRRAKLDIDFITWRGMATKMMTVPFSKLDDWEMNATLFQNTIFIEENHAKKLESRQQQDNAGASRGNMSQDLMSFWGYKFETLSLLPDTWSKVSREYIESREDQVVSNYAQYCSVVRTGFGHLKMLLGGEVDAVMDYKPEDSKTAPRWVELKTTAEVHNDRDQVKLERKLLKFWAQSFLLGVPKIIVGYRNQQGLLQRLEEMDTQSIPEKVRLQGKNLWNGDVCIAFTSALLRWLKQTITTEGVWRLRKRSNVPVLELFKVEETGHGDILSQSFVEWRTDIISQGEPTHDDTKHDDSDEKTFRRNGDPQAPEIEAITPEGEPDQADLEEAKKRMLRSLQQDDDQKPP